MDITTLFKEMIKNKENNSAIYSIQNSFMIKILTNNSNIILPSGDNGLFSPLLEIVLSK